MNRSGARPSLLAWLTVLSLAPVAALAAGEVDTFYQRLLEDGIDLASGGEYGEAAGKLRLACFGMLDHPSMLGPCLSHLLTAQDAAGAEQDEIESTVDRLLEVEERYRGWSEPVARFMPSADLRRRVEALFARFGTADRLSSIPGLGDVALQKQAAHVAALPAAERRKQLNLLVQRQASIAIWHVMSAELSLEDGNDRAAARAASEILRKFNGHGPARCVRGRARSGLGECDDASIQDLVQCPADHDRRADIDQALLTCLVEAGRWREADRVLRRLPADRQHEREVRRLKRRIEKKMEEGKAAGATGAAVTEVPSGGAAGTDGAPGDGAPRHAEAPIYAPPPGVDDDTADFAGLPDADGRTLRSVRDALASERRDLYGSLWIPMRKVARHRDESAVAQRLAGRLAFRLARWRDAVRFLRRGESLARSRPELQFHLALALHYQGEREEARREFERCRQRLSPSAWVDFWARELGAGV